MSQIILASSSPRRKKLLEQINIPFEVHPSSVGEDFAPSLSPEEIVCELALRKSRDIALNYSNALVIGADTIVAFQGTILEKPADAEEARHMLAQLSDNTHQVYTGVALCKTGSSNNILNTVSFFECTDVTFGKIDPEDIKRYVAGGSPMDKAGAYGIQDDYGAIFVKKVVGDFYNVVGFPLHSFYNKLRNFAPDLHAKTVN